MTSTRTKPKSLGGEIAEVIKNIFGIDTRIKNNPAQKSQAKDAKILEKAKHVHPRENIVNVVISSGDQTIDMHTNKWTWSSRTEPFVCSILSTILPKNDMAKQNSHLMWPNAIRFSITC